MKLHYILLVGLLLFASCQSVGPNIAIVPDDTFVNVGNNVTIKQESNGTFAVNTRNGENVSVVTSNTTLLVGDYYHECSKKTIHKCFTVTVASHNPDVDVSTSPEDVWEIGGKLDLPQIGEGFSGGPGLTIFSDSINDTPGSNGTFTLLLEGLDGDYRPISETIIMNGTTNVTSSKNYWRLNRATSITSGSFGTNVGTITIVARFTPRSTWMIVSPNHGTSKNSQFFSPAGITAWLVRAEMYATKTQSGQKPIVEFKYRTRDVNGSWIQRFEAKIDTEIQTQIIIEEPIQEPLGQRMDTVMEVSSNQNDAEVFVRLYYILDGNTTIGMFER